MATDLERGRRRIDEIDAELVGLLNRRTRLALRLAEHKRVAGLGLRDRERELEVLARAQERNGGPLAPEAVERLFRAILSESRRTQASAFERSPASRRLPCA